MNAVAESDSIQTSNSRAILGVRGAVFVLLAILPIIHAFAATGNIPPDLFLYAQTAKEVMAGERLYDSTWMDKPPLGILIYAIPQLIAPRSYEVLAAFGGLCVAATAGMLAVAFRRHPLAMLSGALFVALFPFVNWDFLWLSTEVLSNVFVTVSLLVSYRIHEERRFTMMQCAAIGVAACLAFHVRQNTVACIGAGLVPLLNAEVPRERKALGLAAMSLGAIASWTAILGLVAGIADLPGYFWTVFVHPRAYADSGSALEVSRLIIFLWETPLPALIAMLASLAVGEKRDVVFLVTLGVLAIAVVCAPFREYWHYWVSAFPYVALLLSMALKHASEFNPKLAVAATVAVICMTVPVVPLRLYSIERWHYLELMEAAAAVDALAAPDATLLVCDFGSEPINFASRLRPAHRHEWMLHLRPPWNQMLPKTMDEIVRQYLERPPDVIVVRQDVLSLVTTTGERQVIVNDLKLLSDLLGRYPYRAAAARGNYLVLVREPAGKSPVKASVIE